MANEVNIYSPRYLAEVVRQAPPVRTYFRDTFFTNVKPFSTERVDIDLVKGDRRMAAFVHPRLGGKVLTANGYTTESYKPPLVNPYIVARMTGGAIKDESGPQTVEFSLIVCAYDEGGAREGYQDVANIKEDIVQRVCTRPYFGGAFTILKPVVWAMQQDDTHPYYFGACTLTCTAPAMTQDTELEGLV